MIPWLKSLLYDPNSFANFVRAGMFALGELPSLVDLGAAGGKAYYVGKALQALALLVKAGDKNATAAQP
jgi:hypothetical protein